MKINNGKPHSANPCPHKYIRKAYYLGLPGEDYVCVACGESRPESEWPNFLRRNEPNSSSP